MRGVPPRALVGAEPGYLPRGSADHLREKGSRHAWHRRRGWRGAPPASKDRAPAKAGARGRTSPLPRRRGQAVLQARRGLPGTRRPAGARHRAPRRGGLAHGGAMLAGITWGAVIVPPRPCSASGPPCGSAGGCGLGPGAGSHCLAAASPTPRPGGALVGGALATSGALFQGLFRNPMADPYVLGISSGAAFGATVALAARPCSCPRAWGRRRSGAG